MFFSRGYKGSETKISLDIDPVKAKINKAKRRYKLNVIQVPAIRLGGFVFLCLFVLLHNKYVLGDLKWNDFWVFVAIAYSYGILSWVVLYLFFERVEKIDLGMLFMTLDIPIFVLAIYFSGGERSLLFLLLCVRVADQLYTNFRRTMVFAHFPVICYTLLLLYLSYVEQRPISWGAEGVKLFVVYLSNLYLTITAMPGEQIRNRTRASMKLARDLIRQLDQRTNQFRSAKADAESASRAKTEFLANMSHELRTPLNHIIGFTEVLLDKSFGQLNEKQEEYLSDVHHSGKHLLSLLNDILDLSKVEAGKLELELGDFELGPLLENSIIIVSEAASKGGIRLTKDLDNLPDSTRADKRKVKQIIYNLLSNAVKYTPKGGMVRITAKQTMGGGTGIKQSDEVTGEYIEIAVSDTGTGIEPNNLDRIFEPFEQTRGPENRKPKGTGLGLSLTKKFVELHGGKIWAESDGIGKGATFYVFIPALTPETEKG